MRCAATARSSTGGGGSCRGNSTASRPVFSPASPQGRGDVRVRRTSTLHLPGFGLIGAGAEALQPLFDPPAQPPHATDRLQPAVEKCQRRGIVLAVVAQPIENGRGVYPRQRGAL